MFFNDANLSILFSDGYLSQFDFKSKLRIILELINDTSEEDVFGESVVRWKITKEGRELIKRIVVENYKKIEEKEVLDESDDKDIYKGMVTKYLEYCLRHEDFIIKTDSSVDIRRIGLKNINNLENQPLYAICRVHTKTGVATFIGYDPDNLYPDDDDRRGSFLITTKDAVLNIISHCNIVETPESDDGYTTLYFVSPTHLIPKLPDSYNIIIRK